MSHGMMADHYKQPAAEHKGCYNQVTFSRARRESGWAKFCFLANLGIKASQSIGQGWPASASELSNFPGIFSGTAPILLCVFGAVGWSKRSKDIFQTLKMTSIKLKQLHEPGKEAKREPDTLMIYINLYLPNLS